MKIIDAHLHYARAPHFEQCALEAGHISSAAHLAQVFEENNIAAAVAMGTVNPEGQPLDAHEHLESAVSCPRVIDLNGDFTLTPYSQPHNIYYCAGVASHTLSKANLQKSLEVFEQHLRSPHCVGLKLYPGYNYFYVYDELYHEFYDLAAAYNVPVVIHTGDTSKPDGLVKYSHPLTVDEVAVRFPKTKFVIAHLGNPWIIDAVEVIKKNPNVYADLSGLAAGNFQLDWFLKEYAGYVQHLQTWLQYLSAYDKVMYGTDWPLINIPIYIQIIRHLIPAQHHEQVFAQNALQVFSKIKV